MASSSRDQSKPSPNYPPVAMSVNNTPSNSPKAPTDASIKRGTSSPIKQLDFQNPLLNSGLDFCRQILVYFSLISMIWLLRVRVE